MLLFHIGSRPEKPSTFGSVVQCLKTVIVFGVLLTLSCTPTKSQTCQSDEECRTRRKCCNTSCPLRVSCHGHCSKETDCDGIRDEKCVDTCNQANCSRHSTLEMPVICSRNTSECAIRCRNGTCQCDLKHDVLDSQPLSPVVLAVVAIAGVFIFGCLFYCCLNRMKSDRPSAKIRNARRRQMEATPSLEESRKDGDNMDHQSTQVTQARVEDARGTKKFIKDSTILRCEGLAAIPEEDVETAEDREEAAKI